AMRRSFADRADVVGVRIDASPGSFDRPWYLTEGQLHYLGIHRPGGPFSSWGACLGINADLARAHGLRFREDLGRRGTDLASGDDTTFIREMKDHGAREVFLDRVCVH